MSKGHVFFAQNSETNYVRQAYALALSIKLHNKINQTCLITNDPVPDRYKKAFDYIVEIPWNDDAKDSVWKIENRWKIIYVTPFKENLVYDSDMLLLNTNDHWWDVLKNKDVVLSSKVYNYRGHTITSNFYRQLFEENNLPNTYFGLHYFKKNERSFEFYKWLEILTKNYNIFYKKFCPSWQQTWCSMDVSSSLALKILDAETEYTLKSLSVPTFVHMKPGIQDWSYTPESWYDTVSTVFTDDCVLKVGNIQQTGVFHYVEEQFLTDDIIMKLEKRLTDHEEAQ
jgi:hypothetical protein